MVERRKLITESLTEFIPTVISNLISEYDYHLVGKCDIALKNHFNSISCCSVLSNGKIITGTYCGIIQIWNTQTIHLENHKSKKCNGCEFYNLIGHTSSVSCFSELSDGKIVSGSTDGTCKIWNTQTKKCELTLGKYFDWMIYCCVLFGGYIVVSGLANGKVKIWNTQTDRQSSHQDKCELSLSCHSDSISCCASLKNGRIVTGSYDYTLKIWNIETQKCELTLKGHSDFVSCCSIFPARNGNKIISGSFDRTLKIWNIQTDNLQVKCELTLFGHSLAVNCCSVLPNGQIVSGSADETVKIWNSQTGECLLTLEGHSSAVMCSNILPDGRLVTVSRMEHYTYGVNLNLSFKKLNYYL